MIYLEMTELQLRADGASEEFIKHDRTLRSAVYSIVKREPNYDTAQKALRRGNCELFSTVD